MSSPEYRFDVALSFPGEHRARIQRIAELLAKHVPTDRILYDHWHRAEFARPNLDTYIPNLYHTQSRLLVFFFCKEYAEKDWTGLEWRAGKDLLKHKQDGRLMFFRFDDAEISGIYSGDGYIDMSRVTDEQASADILTRLGMTVAVGGATVDEMVTELRHKLTPDILARCSHIRILSMEKPVDLGGVYTDVLMLEKRPVNTRKTKDEIVQELRLGERFGAAVSTSTKRVSGVSVFDHAQRIVIYGKPGAGKTTFLKHLASECARGNFRPDLAPVFITLRDYADAKNEPTLFDYISIQWAHHQNSQRVLQAGRALILLDGLDEVRDKDIRRICKAVESFAYQFSQCVIAVTCRIAAREYAFEAFTEVEMADFTEDQIKSFATCWFRAHLEEDRAPAFLKKLQANKPIWELARSPLLLTLLCLIFQDRNDFDGSRADLYRQGLDVLFYQWDARRGIERDPIDKSALEKLLQELAFTRFLKGEFLFEKRDLEMQIVDILRKRNLASSKLEPTTVLNSIEAHLGLLVARAEGVYSFSHLTFQEYMTALHVTRKQSLLSQLKPAIGHMHWREVWLLLIGMLDADDLLIEMKAAIDFLVEKDTSIQNLLGWCSKKARIVDGYKPAAVRAFYFDLGSARYVSSDLDRVRVLARASTSDLDLARASTSVLDLDRVRVLASASARVLVRDLALDLDRARDLARVLALARARDLALDLDLDLAVDPYVAPELVEELNKLRADLPRTIDAAWIRSQFPEWRERLRSAAIRHRDIGHDWNLTGKQVDLCRQYYEANLLLVECLSAARGVSTEVRNYIESTMLLPAAEIPQPPSQSN